MSTSLLQLLFLGMRSNKKSKLKNDFVMKMAVWVEVNIIFNYEPQN